jgi:uncharacterized membrane protein
MRTPASLAGHPIHPMLVTIPVGLWLFSFVCDLVALGSDNAATWATVSLYAMGGGILGALAAAIPGFIDMLSLRGRPVQKTALLHMTLNLIVLFLFAANLWLRVQGSTAPALLIGLSLVAILLLAMSGWLGGKMVYEAGVGVHPQDAQDTISPEAWQRQRSGDWQRSPRGAGGAHATAADSARPSREREAGRAGAKVSPDDPTRPF